MRRKNWPLHRTSLQRSRSSQAHTRRKVAYLETLEARNMLSAMRILPGFTANELARNDDASTAAVDLGFSLNFFGSIRDSLYINNNGNITFDAPLADYTPEAIDTLEREIISPFWADVDTRALGSGVVTFGIDQVDGRDAFGVNWQDVGFFEQHDTPLNSFQLVLIDRSDVADGAFDIEFNYDQIDWETGDASSGAGGVGGVSARAGFSNGSGVAGTSYELVGSGVNGAFLDENTTFGLATHRLGSSVDGRYRFEVRQGSMLDEMGLAGQLIEVAPGFAFLGNGLTPDQVRILTTDNAAAADSTNADQLRGGGGLGLNLTGAGLTVGIWEAIEDASGASAAYIRPTHDELNGRVTIVDTNPATAQFSNHATHVAGTIGANGTDANARGMAPGVAIRSYDSANDVAEMAAAAGIIAASNHSYGVDRGWTQTRTFAALAGTPDTWLADRSTFATEDPLFGKYDASAVAVDTVLFNNPNLLSVWSAGNDRNDSFTNALGTNQYVAFFSVAPAGTNLGAGWWLVTNAGATVAPPNEGNGGTGFDTLVGDHTAKNSLVIGAIQDITADPYPTITNGQMTGFSAWGPTDDGRVKPDLVANGDQLYSSQAGADDAYGNSSGTSMAAPNVTGTALLLMEHYNNLVGSLPSSATTKGVLIHNAFDAGLTGPDYTFGWGLVDGAAAATFLSQLQTPVAGTFHQLVEASLSPAAVNSFDVTVSSGQPLKVTLVWTDAAGNAQPAGLDDATRVLVNDLDLSIVGPDGTYLPWTLDPNNPTAGAVRTQRNLVDNVEQVLIDVPVSGTYSIRVGHTGALQNNNAQGYSLLVSAALWEPDAFEPNNTIATATVLGSEPVVTLRDLTIHDADDVDFFKITAHSTGIMIFNAYFDHELGDLDIRVYDMNGNIIATAASSSDNEQLVIPVVGQQRYFLEVYGFDDATNGYQLEIENFPVPIPSGVSLEAISDTGSRDDDRVTNDQTPQLLILADLNEWAAMGITVLTPAQATAAQTAGAAVEVFITNTSTGVVTTGFATAVGPSNTIFRFTPSVNLGEGVYLVTAAVRIFDGRQDTVGDPDPATARSLLSVPITVTIDVTAPLAALGLDMLASSDSGTLNNDNVTNKSRPAFSGTGEPNSKVRILANGVVVGAGTVTPAGNWEITTDPLVDGQYQITVVLEDAAGNVSVPSAPLTIEVDTLTPNTALLDLLSASDTGRTNLDNVTFDNTPTVSMTTEDPNEALHLLAANFKYRIFDRAGTAAEVLIYDSFADLGGLTALEFITTTLALLADGPHNLKLEVEDRAGNISDDFLLNIVVDTVAPTVTFGEATSTIDGLLSDTGVTGQPATFTDRITSDNTPTLQGRAEANAIVRLYEDVNGNGIVDVGDRLLGQTTAGATDGNQAQPPGEWQITSNLVLADGPRRLLATAEDLAGNVGAPDALVIFVDTASPRLADVLISDDPTFDLFGNKSEGTLAPTPLVNQLDLVFTDLPMRVDLGGGNVFIYPAVNEILAETVGNYQVVGDATGVATIVSAVIIADVNGPGGQRVTTVRLTFASPLPDDRFTLIVNDSISDDPGNALDGESQASSPFGGGGIAFPTGDGTPGGDFNGRFTVDSRPEIAVYSSGSVAVDINGNFYFDPDNADAVNRDLTFNLGFASDRLFTGNFRDAGGAADGFDKLGVYGFVNGQWRFLLDRNSDGVINTADGDINQVVTLQVDGLPFSGDFVPGLPGDEVGVFDGTNWYIDTNGNFDIDPADLVLVGNMRGYPIAGDFDGNGFTDLGTWSEDRFFVDLADAAGNLTGNSDATINFGFTGVLERPVAADMDQDGIDDIGLWVPGRSQQVDRVASEWYFLVSGERFSAAEKAPHFGTVNFLNHPFEPVPFGDDLFAKFGDEFGIPLLGNFDPPITEDIEVPGDTAALVDALYLQILDRVPHPSERDYWTGRLADGMSYIDLAAGFINSVERRTKIIDQLYLDYLGRAADAGGIQFWLQVWADHKGPEQVQAGIIGSQEFYDTAGGTDESWVTALYQNILGRAPEQAGLDYWTNHIKTNSRASVVLGFVTSDEYRLEIITGWYLDYLNRQIDVGGGQYWVEKMRNGMKQETLQIMLISSEEYRNNI